MQEQRGARWTIRPGESSERTCNRCFATKPITEFYPQGFTKGGLPKRMHKCVTCHTKINKALAEARYTTEYRRERQAVYNSRRTKEQKVATRLRIVYGLQADDVTALRDSQDGRCAICRRLLVSDAPGARENVDHCHATGVVRGLLCTPCNQGIGFFQDNPELMRSAIQYVETQGVPLAVSSQWKARGHWLYNDPMTYEHKPVPSPE